MMTADSRYCTCMIDANFLNLIVACDPAALVIEESQFQIIMAHSVKSELERPQTPFEVKKLRHHFIYSVEVVLTPPEEDRLRVLTSLIRGDAGQGKHDADAMHLFEASKYGSRFFLTRDKRLIRKANEIGDLTSVLVVHPTEFAKMIGGFED